VCSTTAARIARICAAIEELANRPDIRDAVSVVARGTAALDAVDGHAADRLAAIWAMIAEVDPELARRLPGYLEAGD
jgi:hypothetical protein